MRKPSPPASQAEPHIPTVSIFVETATSWGRRVVAGILAHAKENGPWHIHIEPRGPDEAPEIPPHWKADGVIARVGNNDFALRLAKLGIPVVNVSSIKLPDANFPRVTTSSEAVCRMAADHFQIRGFFNYGYIGNFDQSYVHGQYDTFVRELASRGHTCSACRHSGSRGEILKWLKGLPKPVGILCWGPRIGRLVIDTCLDAGIPVPHDVAVLGADYDELQSEASHPAQSGIRMASEQIGLMAAATLHRMMQGHAPERIHQAITSGAVVAKRSSDTLAIADPGIAAAMRFIQTRFRERIGVPDVLAAVPMARRSLERKFRQAFGLSVVDRIRQIRVNEARLLLAGTNDPITLIAEKCGFTSYTYMGRVFQNDTGMTPSDYRAQFRPRKIKTTQMARIRTTTAVAQK
jgi:LacI family transcriptional regulator